MRFMKGKDLNSDPALLRLRLFKKNIEQPESPKIGKVAKLTNMERISYLGKLLNKAQTKESDTLKYMDAFRFLGLESKDQLRNIERNSVVRNSKKMDIFDDFLKNAKAQNWLKNEKSDNIKYVNKKLSSQTKKAENKNNKISYLFKILGNGKLAESEPRQKMITVPSSNPDEFQKLVYIPISSKSLKISNLFEIVGEKKMADQFPVSKKFENFQQNFDRENIRKAFSGLLNFDEKTLPLEMQDLELFQIQPKLPDDKEHLTKKDLKRKTHKKSRASKLNTNLLRMRMVKKEEEDRNEAIYCALFIESGIPAAPFANPGRSRSDKSLEINKDRDQISQMFPPNALI